MKMLLTKAISSDLRFHSPVPANKEAGTTWYSESVVTLRKSMKKDLTIFWSLTILLKIAGFFATLYFVWCLEITTWSEKDICYVLNLAAPGIHKIVGVISYLLSS